MKKPWDKNNEESDLAYMYFNSYLSLGATRSMPKVCQMYTKKETYLTQLKRWSAEHDWVNRCSEYDTYMIEKILEDQQKFLNKSRALLIENIVKVVDELLDIALGDMSVELKQGETLIISNKLKAIDMILKVTGMYIIPERATETVKNESVQDYVMNIYNQVRIARENEN